MKNAKLLDIPMMLSSIPFLVPGSIHWQLGERFEASMYLAVTITSILSDAVFCNGNKYDKYTTVLDRIVASSALIAAIRRGWLARSAIYHRVYLLASVCFAGMFLLRGRKHMSQGDIAKYRRYHMTWHMCLSIIGYWSATYQRALPTNI